MAFPMLLAATYLTALVMYYILGYGLGGAEVDSLTTPENAGHEAAAEPTEGHRLLEGT